MNKDPFVRSAVKHMETPVEGGIPVGDRKVLVTTMAADVVNDILSDTVIPPFAGVRLTDEQIETDIIPLVVDGAQLYLDEVEGDINPSARRILNRLGEKDAAAYHNGAEKFIDNRGPKTKAAVIAVGGAALGAFGHKIGLGDSVREAVIIAGTAATAAAGGVTLYDHKYNLNNASKRHDRAVKQHILETRLGSREKFGSALGGEVPEAQVQALLDYFNTEGRTEAELGPGGSASTAGGSDDEYNKSVLTILAKWHIDREVGLINETLRLNSNAQAEKLAIKRQKYDANLTLEGAKESLKKAEAKLEAAIDTDADVITAKQAVTNAEQAVTNARTQLEAAETVLQEKERQHSLGEPVFRPVTLGDVQQARRGANTAATALGAAQATLDADKTQLDTKREQAKQGPAVISERRAVSQAKLAVSEATKKRDELSNTDPVVGETPGNKALEGLAEEAAKTKLKEKLNNKLGRGAIAALIVAGVLSGTGGSGVYENVFDVAGRGDGNRKPPVETPTPPVNRGLPDPDEGTGVQHPDSTPTPTPSN